MPRDLRDGGYALGADKLQVSTRIVVPAAISGILAAFVLAFSRAVGETMIVLIAAGQLPQITFDPRETIETMTAFIGATGNGDVPTGSIEYKTIFAVGLTLFVITLVMNLLSIRLVRKFREVYEVTSSHGEPVEEPALRGARCCSRCSPRSGRSRVLLVDTLVTGWPASIEQLFTRSALDVGRGGRRAPGDPRHALPRRPRPRSSRFRSASLTAIYLEEYADRSSWWNRSSR